MAKKATEEKIEEAVVKTVKKAAKELKEDVEQMEEEFDEAATKITKAVAPYVAKEAEELAEASPRNVLIVEKTKKGKKEEPTSEDDKKKKIAALKEKLKEKAKALEGKVKGEDSSGIKEKVTGEKEDKKDLLVPIEDYLKSSIHLGTRVITPDMRKFVYKRRADGLAVFNTNIVDDKLREAIDYLSQYSPEDIILVCKREAGWKAANMFAETLNIRSFTKKYPAGILTNTNLENFTEAKLIFIADPWLDKNAFTDANNINVPVMAVCDTNNFTKGIDFILPGNNKSWKSLGIIFYLLAKGYVEKRKLDIQVPSIQDFVEGWDGLQPPA